MPHTPVLLHETIKILDPQPGEFFIDGTIGNGGHGVEIFKKILPDGRLLGIDWDAAMIERLKIEKLKDFKNVILVHGNYADLPEILKKNKLPKADGLLIDLGMSSEQLEKSGRGFSFLRNEPLDMRYRADQHGEECRQYFRSQTCEILTAAEVVNNFSEQELADIFYQYGQERYSRRIAKKIVEERRKKPIKTTFDLVKVILAALFNISTSDVDILKNRRFRRGRLHPATRVFQALRIYVNDELGNLEKLLKNLDKILKPKGRAAIISYHSLEDRLVKKYFREIKNQGKAQILTSPEGKPSVSRGAGKPIRPTLAEVLQNPRARSAKLRAIIFR